MVNGEKVVEIKKLACSRSDRPDLYIAKIKQSNHIFLLGSEDGKTLTPKAIFMTYFSKQTVYSTISTGKFRKYLRISVADYLKALLLYFLISRK